MKEQRICPTKKFERGITIVMDIHTMDSDFSASKKLKAIKDEPVDDADMEDYGDDYDDDDDDQSDEDHHDSDFYDSDDDDQDPYKDEYALLQSQFDKADLPTGVEVSIPSLIEPSTSYKESKSSSASSSSTVEGKKIDSLLESLQHFKRFDVVDAFLDHQYSESGKSEIKPGKSWAKRINKEWKSLSTDLPETIFVRVSEERMDLLRAVIVGPSGTPYHDGLFVFDCQFPPSYPNKAPLVHYHSGGLRINPNLYKCGKVCLSLLGTWSGKSNENWVPNESTMLQVLVSIQALILNEQPFFNEPGYSSRFVGQEGKRKSQEYSENVLIFSLKTMIYTMRKPPEHFKDLVVSHFRRRGRDILVACRAYTEGAVVASDVKKFKRFDQRDQEKGSEGFKSAVNGMMNSLVACFSRNGTPNCDEFRVDPKINFDPKVQKP